MPSVEKVRRNSDGSYWTRIQWYAGSQRQTPVTVRAKTLAQLQQSIRAEEGRLEHEIHLHRTSRGDDPLAVGDVMTCNDLVRKWLALHVAVQLTGATPNAYAIDAADWFCPFWGERSLSSVGRAEGLEWRAWLLDEITAAGKSRLGDYEHAGRPRVNRLLTMGQSIFTFAVKNGWIDERRHPLKNVDPLPYMAPAETDEFVFEPELAEAIRLVIAEVKPQHRGDAVLQLQSRLAISCLAYIGLTQQDLFDARFNQALHDDGSPRDYFVVPRRPSGSGRKSKNRAREIEIPSQVQDEFAALWQARGCPPLNELIVVNGAGRRYTRQNWQRDFWRPALAAVKELRVETVGGAAEGKVVELRSGKPRSTGRPRFHDVPAGEGLGPHAARRCAVRLWALAGWLDAEVLDAIGHDTTNSRTLYRFYAKAKKGLRKRDGFVWVEDQIAAARDKYSTPDALAERDRVLADARAEADANAARQKVGRRGIERASAIRRVA